MIEIKVQNWKNPYIVLCEFFAERKNAILINL